MLLFGILLVSCCSAVSSSNSTLPEGEFADELEDDVAPLGTEGSVMCQPNPVLNALLLQMLMSSFTQPKSTQQQQLMQQQAWQNPQFAMPNLNELLPPRASPIRTTLITSSFLSTLTRTQSTVVSIWFRNVRIPTTVYSSQIQVVTEFTTVTSTLNVEPTLVRERRHQVEEGGDGQAVTRLRSSLLETRPAETDVDAVDGYATQPLISSSMISDSSEFMSVVMQPRVLEAWNHFIQVLDDASKNS